jgi:hypothetical protein
MRLKNGTAMAAVLALLGATAAQAQDKKIIEKASDVPPVVIELTKKRASLRSKAALASKASRTRSRRTRQACSPIRDSRQGDREADAAVLLQVAMTENRWATR